MIKYFKPGVFVLSTIPFVLIVYKIFYNKLGPEPVKEITHFTGEWTLIFICLTLAMSPLKRFTNFNFWIKIRRMLGLFVFFYASLHLLTYVGIDYRFSLQPIFDDVVKKKYIFVGFCRLFCKLFFVFSRYLVKGKPGFVAHEWPSLKTVINLILKANGLPVIAHPARYKLPNNWLTYLLEEFASLGGIGIEVATGSHSLADIERFKKISIEYDFKASRGSDFHSPSESRYDVGRAPYLPDCLLPIWASIGLRG